MQRIGSSMVEYGNELYVFGGTNLTDDPSLLMIKFDYKNNEWGKVSIEGEERPSMRSLHCAFAYQVSAWVRFSLLLYYDKQCIFWLSVKNPFQSGSLCMHNYVTILYRFLFHEMHFEVWQVFYKNTDSYRKQVIFNKKNYKKLFTTKVLLSNWIFSFIYEIFLFEIIFLAIIQTV